jgi:hypothetical protein
LIDADHIRVAQPRNAFGQFAASGRTQRLGRRPSGEERVGLAFPIMPAPRRRSEIFRFVPSDLPDLLVPQRR